MSHNKSNGSSMWMMIVYVFVLIILLTLGSKLLPAGYQWPVFIGIFAVAHIWMMFRGHRAQNDERSNETETRIPQHPMREDHQKDKGQHGGCCHP